jgi:hypothetical protein
MRESNIPDRSSREKGRKSRKSYQVSPFLEKRRSYLEFLWRIRAVHGIKDNRLPPCLTLIRGGRA